jgi:hypothetical protein
MTLLAFIFSFPPFIFVFAGGRIGELLSVPYFRSPAANTPTPVFSQHFRFFAKSINFLLFVSP